MIQGGDPTGTGRGGESIWGDSFEDEFNVDYHNIRGALSMANAGPGTNGSQFFITTAETPWLNGRHTIFGAVTDETSQAVVDAIAATPVDRMDRPVEPVVITSVTLA